MAAESLEARTLPAVSALLIGTELNITALAGDSIRVPAYGSGRVEILANGAPLASAPNVAAAAIQSLIVTGSDADNVIDLGKVTAAQFTALTSIVADGGNRADTLDDGMNNDSLLGDAGDDFLRGGEGDDVVDGQGGTDTLAGNEGVDTLLNGEVINEAFTLPASLLATLEA